MHKPSLRQAQMEKQAQQIHQLQQAQQIRDLPDRGNLAIQVTSTIGLLPVQNANISISFTGAPDQVIEQVSTNENGKSENVSLPTPPLEYSLNPDNEQQPYSEFNLNITAPGYEPVVIDGSQILADENALQQVTMNPVEDLNQVSSDIVIPPHTLYGVYPPKIPEAEIKPTAETGEIVLSRVVVPEYVVVHNGPPTDSSATNYYVKYKDYIKNVVSSEIYATWPEATIYANTLCILSFTLNRVFTEWYRNR